jgi:HTH-type transcriptional regulator / antitoxin HigA
MTIKPIRNDDDLKKVFRRLEQIFHAEEGTTQADERDVLVTLVAAYENRHYDFGPADPVEAIKFRTEQEGPTPRDLEPFIGPSGRVSEVLNRKRPLSLRMVKRLHDGLKIPYESLLAEVSWLRCSSRCPPLLATSASTIRGPETPEASLKGLRVYRAVGESAANEVPPPPSPRMCWTRRELPKASSQRPITAKTCRKKVRRMAGWLARTNCSRSMRCSGARRAQPVFGPTCLHSQDR